MKSEMYNHLCIHVQINICKRDEKSRYRRKTETVLPESEPNADLDRLHLALPPTPPRFSRCARWGFIPVVEGIPSTSNPPRAHPNPSWPDHQKGTVSPPCTSRRTWFGPGATLLQAGQCPLRQVPPGADDPGQPGGPVYVHSPFLLLLDIIGRVMCHPEMILKIQRIVSPLLLLLTMLTRLLASPPEYPAYSRGRQEASEKAAVSSQGPTRCLGKEQVTFGETPGPTQPS